MPLARTLHLSIYPSLSELRKPSPSSLLSSFITPTSSWARVHMSPLSTNTLLERVFVPSILACVLFCSRFYHIKPFIPACRLLTARCHRQWKLGLHSLADPHVCRNGVFRHGPRQWGHRWHFRRVAGHVHSRLAVRLHNPYRCDCAGRTGDVKSLLCPFPLALPHFYTPTPTLQVQVSDDGDDVHVWVGGEP